MTPFPAPAFIGQSYFDQLPDAPSGKVLDFLFKPQNGIRRCAGTQKQTAKNMQFLTPWNVDNLHYTLGQATYGPDAGGTGQPVQSIVNGAWGTRWPQYNLLDYLFLKSTLPGNPRMHNGAEKWWLLDINNPQCRQRILTDMLTDIAAVPGTKGVFLDEFIPLTQARIDVQDPRFFGSANADPNAWAPDPSWLQQQQSWLTYLTSALHAKGLWVVVNLGNLTTGWAVPPLGMDAAMIEEFGMWGGGRQGDPSDWILQMNRCLKLGCPLILQSPTQLSSPVFRGFFFSSGLLLDNAYFNLCDGDSAAPYWWPENEKLRTLLGAPLLSAKTIADFAWLLPNGNYYKRSFQNGLVLVNPGNTTITPGLPQPMQPVSFSGGGLLTDAAIDASGNYVGGSVTLQPAVTSVVLLPGSGMVLANTIAPPSPPQASFATLTTPDGKVWKIPMT